MEAARLAHVARAQLVAEQSSVTYKMLAEAQGSTETTVRQRVRRLRDNGRLVTVEVDGTTLVPSFQFDEAYEPIDKVGATVAKLIEAGLSGWAVWRWFTAVNPWLEERPVTLVAHRRYAELLALADRVLAAQD